MNRPVHAQPNAPGQVNGGGAVNPTTGMDKTNVPNKAQQLLGTDDAPLHDPQSSGAKTEVHAYTQNCSAPL